MELKVRDGDYIPDGRGGFLRVQDHEELLQRVMWKLSIPRGSFPFLPELGSRLHLLLREKPLCREALASQYVAEALADEVNLLINGVSLSETGVLQVRITQQGETLEVTVYL